MPTTKKKATPKKETPAPPEVDAPEETVEETVEEKAIDPPIVPAAKSADTCDRAGCDAKVVFRYTKASGRCGAHPKYVGEA